MEYLVEWTIAGIIIVLGPILTIFDLPGNTLMMLTAIGYAFLTVGCIWMPVCYQVCFSFTF